MLINSIQEVEALLIEAAAERKRLAKYNDSANEVKALTLYIYDCITVLQRTNLYFYDRLYKSCDDANFEYLKEVQDQFKVALNNIKKDKQLFSICPELARYFSEKEIMARAFKNMFSESDLTVKRENNRLDKLATKYQFIYHADGVTPGCPILPVLDKLSIHRWENGAVQYYFDEDIGQPIQNLDPNRYHIILPAKPITRESKTEKELFSAEFQFEEPELIEAQQKFNNSSEFADQESKIVVRNRRVDEDFYRVFYGENKEN